MERMTVSYCDDEFEPETTAACSRAHPTSVSSRCDKCRVVQQQPAAPQPQPSPTTEIGCGRAGISGSAAASGVAGLVARMMAPWSPSPTACVGTTSTSVSPTAAKPARYSLNDNAPAMQPT